MRGLGSVTEMVTQRRASPRVDSRNRMRGHSRLIVLSSLCVLVSLTACGSDGQSNRAATEVPVARDSNPEPKIVEVSLVAEPAQVELLPGTLADVWAYRDANAKDAAATVPGPLIRANVGDRVIVHLRNALPETTTIHWHGVRVPPMSDGTPSSQKPIPSGGDFTYDFTTDDAGTFWYHPHVRGDVQIERGLYGMVVVSGGPPIPVDADRAFVLDDVKLSADGKLSSQTTPLDLMLGRQGNVLLVNGRQRGSIEMKSGGRERWRFVNSANGRYFNLRLPGQHFLVIGWDGGLLATPYEADTLLISPGERYEVLVSQNLAAGARLALQTIHYDRGHEVPDPGPVDILSIAVAGASAMGSAPMPATWGKAVELVAPPGAAERKLVLSEEEKVGSDPRFLINAQAFPDVPPVTGNEGDVAIWSIRNDAEMDHPFHLHGMFFRVLDIDGVPPEHLGWKDTVNIPQKRTLRFAVRYGTPGTWMFHCHILEHAERGMMGELVLSPHVDVITPNAH